MGTTANRALRYPASTAAPNVPLDVGNLAADVDAALGVFQDWFTPSSPAVIPLTSLGATSGSGLATIGAVYLRQDGRTIGFLATITYNGPTVTVNADGNVANTPLAQVPTAYAPATQPQNQTLQTGGAGALADFSISAAGVLSVIATTPGATITAGTLLSISGSWFI